MDMQIKRKEAKLVEKYYHSFQSVEVKQIEEILEVLCQYS